MALNNKLFLWSFILLLTDTTYSQSCQPFKIQAQHLNKKLHGYKLSDMKVLSHHQCAKECMFVGACISINFIISNKTCELNTAGSETANQSDFAEVNGTIFSDISEWPQSMVGGCKHHQCNKRQRCTPLSKDLYKCVIAKTIGTTCTHTSDCKETAAICNQGYCFCNRFYRYDPDAKDCIKVCTALTDSFTVTRGMRVSGMNDRGISTNTLADCHTVCIEDEDCMSFEYNTDSNRCRRSSVSKPMVEDALPNFIKFDNEEIEFYDRTCS